MDDLPEQGVAEHEVGIALSPGRHEDPSIHDLAKGIRTLGRREVRDRDEQLVVDPGPGRRCDAEDLLARLRDGATRARTTSRSRAGQLAVVRLARHGEDLFREEGVPTGPLQGPVDETGVRDMAELVGQQPRQVVPIEPGKVDPVDALAALELGQKGHERAARVDFVRADRGDEQDALVAQVADQEREEVPRRRIGPLEVLDDEDDGGMRASRWRTPSTSSNRRTWAKRSSGGGPSPVGRIRRVAESWRSGRPRTSGMSRASSPRLGPSSAGSAPGSTSRKSARKASTNGPYGSPPVPSARQPPLRTRPPEPATPSANVATRRDLPIPASPATITILDSPPDARA